MEKESTKKLVKKISVSICIPTYRRSYLVSEAIESVINNGFTDFEIIVSDDDSDPQVEKLVNKFNDKHPQQITYYSHEQDQVFQNWSFAVNKAKGKYIFKLDDDDLILPGFLAKTVDFLNKNEEVGIVFTGFRVSRNRQFVKNVIDDTFFHQRTVVKGEEYAFSILLNERVPQNHKSAGIFRSELVKKIDFFNQMRTDVMFTIAMASLGKVGYIPEVYFEYRYLEKNKVGMSYHDLSQTLESLERLYQFPWIENSEIWMKNQAKSKSIFYYVVPISYFKDHLVNRGFLEAWNCFVKVVKNYPQVRKNKLFWLTSGVVFVIPQKLYFWLVENIYVRYRWPKRLLNFLVRDL